MRRILIYKNGQRVTVDHGITIEFPNNPIRSEVDVTHLSDDDFRKVSANPGRYQLDKNIVK